MSNTTNPPDAQRKLRFAGRIYKQLPEYLNKALRRAKDCEFPEEHIHRLEHLIKECEAVAELEHCVVPQLKRSVGRPRKGSKTIGDMCRMMFETLCPAFIPLKKQIKDNVDAEGKAKPLPGIKFDFTPK